MVVGITSKKWVFLRKMIEELCDQQLEGNVTENFPDQNFEDNPWLPPMEWLIIFMIENSIVEQSSDVSYLGHE